MNLLDKIKYNRDNYVAGKLNYIPFPKEFGIMADWYPGSMRGEYIGITGGTSSAKSQLTRRLYLYGAIEWAIKNKVNLEILWFGLEESVEEAKYNLLSWLLFKTNKLRYNVEHFLSIGKSVFEHDLAAIEKIQPVFDKFWARINFYEATYVSTDIYDAVLKFAEGRGKFYKDDVVLSNVNHKTVFTKYVPDDPDEIIATVFDHLGILEQSENEKSERESMGRMSKIIRQHICKRLNYIGVAVIQQMAAIEDITHINASQVYASLQGFGDNKAIARDMMTIFGITSLYRYQITTARTSQTNIDNGKINLKDSGIEDAQRVVGILKRRYGIVNKQSLLLFDGCVGHFEGIEQFSDITDYVEKRLSYNDGFKMN